MPWRAPLCPACAARLWGRDVHPRFRCPRCRAPLQSNAGTATWSGWASGLVAAVGGVLLIQRLTGNWGVTLAFSEVAVVVAYLVGLAVYGRVLQLVPDKGVAPAPSALQAADSGDEAPAAVSPVQKADAAASA